MLTPHNNYIHPHPHIDTTYELYTPTSAPTYQHHIFIVYTKHHILTIYTHIHSTTNSHPHRHHRHIPTSTSAQSRWTPAGGPTGTFSQKSARCSIYYIKYVLCWHLRICTGTYLYFRKWHFSNVSNCDSNCVSNCDVRNWHFRNVIWENNVIENMSIYMSHILNDICLIFSNDIWEYVLTFENKYVLKFTYSQMSSSRESWQVDILKSHLYMYM